MYFPFKIKIYMYMLLEKTWTSRSRVIKGLCLSDSGTYRLSIDSVKYGVTSVVGNPTNLVSLLYNLPTKNSYCYEKISDMVE